MATLLIVEDDYKTNDAICEYLKPAGHHVIPAYGGGEALRLFRENGIDLVVLDIMLPHVSGLSVLHEIRQTSTIPVLMLTAIEDEYTQVRSFDEQADDYMTKPFSMVLLGKRITALLRRSGQALLPRTVAFGDVTVDFSGYTAGDRSGKIDMSPKEIDLLRRRQWPGALYRGHAPGLYEHPLFLYTHGVPTGDAVYHPSIIAKSSPAGELFHFCRNSIPVSYPFHMEVLFYGYVRKNSTAIWRYQA